MASAFAPFVSTATPRSKLADGRGLCLSYFPQNATRPGRATHNSPFPPKSDQANGLVQNPSEPAQLQGSSSPHGPTAHSRDHIAAAAYAFVLRYRLVDEEPKTLEEIGKRLGLTRERIRQIELESLRRLAGQHEMQMVAAS